LFSDRIFIASSQEPREFLGMPIGDQGTGGDTPGGVGDNPFRHTPQQVVLDEQKTIRVSSGAEEGLNISRTMPQYPLIARTMRVEGTVVLAATISKAGTIENLRVVSGPVMLQQAAIDAVKTWKYKPYMLDGLPVEVETSVNVVFRIEH
jgi:protein TonB